MELKYVITDNDCFAIFSPTTPHQEVARGLWGTPVAAGFCTIAVGYVPKDQQEPYRDTEFVSVHCYGESSSSKLKARPEDSEIIERAIRRYH